MRKGIIDYNCDYCGNLTKCHPYELKKSKHIFCSKGCANLFRFKKIKCICSYCGKEDWRKPSKVQSNIQNDWRYFCNKDCRRKFFIDHPKINGGGKWIPCDNCGTMRYYAQYMIDKRETKILNGFFCSIQCASKAKQSSIKTTCGNCGKPLIVFASSYKPNKNFCNNYCYAQHRRKISQENGGSVLYRGPNWYKQRAIAKFRDGFMCCICGETDKKLQVHHIIPFKEFNYVHKENDNYLIANRLDNLITLCASCHKKAEWNKISIWELELAKFPEM